jgi:integrase/recombinase XerD
MKPSGDVATLIERYFTERLIRQRNVSANTIASYRIRSGCVHVCTGAAPQASLGPGPRRSRCTFYQRVPRRSRDEARRRRQDPQLASDAIRSFFRFASFEEPAHSALIQRVLAIPSKRHDKRQVHFLTRPEIEAILVAPDSTTWLGRRDYTLLLLAVQTGLRLSELISLDRDAIHLGAGAHVRCIGKGRKERCTPLTSHARGALQT